MVILELFNKKLFVIHLQNLSVVIIALEADNQDDVKVNLCFLIFFSIVSIGSCFPIRPVEKCNTSLWLQPNFLDI